MSFLIMLALAVPVAAQDKKPPKKPTGRPPAHSKPTPQQIRKFNELEKKEEKSSGRPGAKTVRAPSPK